MSLRRTLKSLVPARFHPRLRRILNAVLLRDIFVDRMRIANIWRDTGFMHTLALNENQCRKLEKVYGIRFSYIDQELNKQIGDFADTVKYPQLLEVIPSGSRVLDLGCGPGVALWDLKRHRNVDGCGLDILQHSVDIVRAQVLVHEYPDGALYSTGDRIASSGRTSSSTAPSSCCAAGKRMPR